jgi:hypothetical protein
MRRGIPVRSSEAAGWARLCGGLALPVLALGVLGARIGIVPQEGLQPVLIVGFALGLAALGLAVYSLADIWYSGAEGARIALAGILYASPVLVILGLVAAAAIVYPRLTDIATDRGDPPLLIGQIAPGSKFDATRALQGEAYPDIVPHSYPMPLGEVYRAALKVVDGKGWTLIRDVHPEVFPSDPSAPAPGPLVPEDEALVAALALKSVATQSRSGMATETLPGAMVEAPPHFAPEPPANPVPDDQVTLDLLASTPVFGFIDEVSVRMRATPGGTLVDMRSASRSGLHDLGQNARRIRGFFKELDRTLQPDPDA